MYIRSFHCVCTCADYIRTNEYVLLDVTNQSTHWGAWSPAQLNGNHSWAGQRGLNSLQMLAYLLSAYSVTGHDRFLHAWKVCLHVRLHAWEGLGSG